MAYVFFDAEMYRALKDKFYSGAKIVAIGYIYVRSNIDRLVASTRDYPKITILTEWKLGSEKNIVKFFYEYLKHLSSKGPLRLVGYSILDYDIPLLIERLVHFKLGTLKELNEFFYQRVISIDLRLLGLIFNNLTLKGSSLSNAVQNIHYKDPILPRVNNTESGAAVKELYEQRNYEQIEQHLKNDLKEIVYLYRAMEKYVVPRVNSDTHDKVQ